VPVSYTEQVISFLYIATSLIIPRRSLCDCRPVP